MLYGIQLELVGVIIFIGIHFLNGWWACRSLLIDNFGTIPYQIIFSLLAGTSLFALGTGYVDREYIPLLSPPLTVKYLPIFMMPISFFFLLGGLMGKRFKVYVRYPLHWGIIIWSLSHIIANPDLGSVILFGSFLLYGTLGQFLINNREKNQDPSHWKQNKQYWPMIPFVRRSKTYLDFGLFWKTLVSSIIIYLLVLYFHEVIAGLDIVPYLTNPIL